MAVLAGEYLRSEMGHLYKVVEVTDDVVSLTRVNGFTVLAFKSCSIQTLFHPCACPEIKDSLRG